MDLKEDGNKFEGEEEELEVYKKSSNCRSSEEPNDSFSKSKKKMIIFDMFFTSPCVLGVMYVNNSTGFISSSLKDAYGPQYSKSKDILNISAVVVAV